MNDLWGTKVYKADNTSIEEEVYEATYSEVIVRGFLVETPLEDILNLLNDEANLIIEKDEPDEEPKDRGEKSNHIEAPPPLSRTPNGKHWKKKTTPSPQIPQVSNLVGNHTQRSGGHKRVKCERCNKTMNEKSFFSYT